MTVSQMTGAVGLAFRNLGMGHDLLRSPLPQPPPPPPLQYPSPSVRHPRPATASVATAATRKAHGYNKHAVHAERAMREYEQIHRVVTTTRHPSVSREGLQRLGAGLQPVTVILTDMARTQQRPAEPQAS